LRSSFKGEDNPQPNGTCGQGAISLGSATVSMGLEYPDRSQIYQQDTERIRRRNRLELKVDNKQLRI
jgi:hypothetical protein